MSNLFRRLVCRLLGHRCPDIAIVPTASGQDGVIVYCPRCKLIFAGKGHARDGI